MGHNLFADNQLSIPLQNGCGFPFGGVHSFDLHGIHLHVAAFCHLDMSLRIDDAFAGAIADADVLFLIAHSRIFGEEKAVDSVVLGIFLAVHMDAAACHDNDVRIFSHIEVVIHQVIHIALGHTGRNIDGFLCVRLDNDVDAGLSDLWHNVNIFAGLSACAAAVLADVESSLDLTGNIRNHTQQFFGNIIHHNFPLVQTAVLFPLGSTDSFHPAVAAESAPWCPALKSFRLPGQ